MRYRTKGNTIQNHSYPFCAGEDVQQWPMRTAEEPEHGEPEYELERMMDVRNRADGRREFLVRYKGWGPEELQSLPTKNFFMQNLHLYISLITNNEVDGFLSPLCEG